MAERTVAILRGGPHDGRVEQMPAPMPPMYEPCALCGHLRKWHARPGATPCCAEPGADCYCTEFLSVKRLTRDERRGHAQWTGLGAYSQCTYHDTGERDAEGRAIYAYEETA